MFGRDEEGDLRQHLAALGRQEGLESIWSLQCSNHAHASAGVTLPMPSPMASIMERAFRRSQASLLPFVESPDGHMRMMVVFSPFHGEELAGQLGIGEREQPYVVEPVGERLELAFPAPTVVQRRGVSLVGHVMAQELPALG